MAFNEKDVAEVRAWVAAAVADGWSIEPTYESESVERAAKLTRDGWQVQAIMRTPIAGDRHATYYSASVHVWGPDGLAVRPGRTYDGDRMLAGLRTCSACKATDVETQRVGFAGRVCSACLPEQRRRVETPGWCD